MSWSPSDIPDQTGRVAIVTGANTGIGFDTALELARKGADVVLACRSEARGTEAVARIEAEGVSGSASFMELDLSSLHSVERFAQAFLASHDALHLLVNNAGVMIPPFSRTTEGFELQFGVNHLGHFALTGHLLPLLERTGHARIVNVSSNAHKSGRIDFDDPNFETRSYSRFQAYCQSKLANLLFTRELNKRLKGSGVISTAAHPGWTHTDLIRSYAFLRPVSWLIAQPAEMGSLPTLRAATDPQANADDYFGPNGIGEIRGAPVKVKKVRAARDDDAAARLWALSEELTAVRYLAQAA